MKLNRSDTILKLIVEYFIKTAQPVGSHTLIEEYNLPYSSATIRNEMFALEKMELIEKPHTSAGRVPSSKGYRYYCEHLRDKAVSEELKQSLQVIMENKMKSVEEVIKASCEILSHMTSLTSVVIGSEDKKEALASMQLIKINDKSLTAIFVTDKGYVENKTFIVPENVNPDELVKCVSILNERLVGTPICELVEKMESLKPVLNDYIISHDIVYQALLETFLRFASDRMNLYGKEELFNHPEFKNDSEKLLKVMKMLNDTSLLKEVENTSFDIDDMKLKIGNEQEDDVSVVSKKVKIGEEETSICLVGPKRMDYDAAMNALETLTETLNKYFNSQGGNNDA